MSLIDGCRSALHDEAATQLRKLVAVHALLASGTRAVDLDDAVGLDPVAFRDIVTMPDIRTETRPDALLAAAAPIIRALAAEHGYQRLAVFGSVARGDAHGGSDIDLLVQPPEGASSFDFVRFGILVGRVLGRDVDLLSYGGLTPGLDADVHRDATPL